jgi:type I restriction enzyme M protein
MSEDQKKQLEQQLWNIANELRGKMNADEFRDYILGFIFYKYLSEKMEMYANNILKPDGIKYKEIKENSEQGKEYIEAIREESLEKLGYFLKPSELFSELAKRGNGNNDTESNFILEDLQEILNNIQLSTMGTESEEDFDNLFEDMDLNSTKLGKTTDAKNKLIAKVLSHLDKIDFKLENTELDVLGDAYEYLIGQFASGAGKKAGEFYTPQQVSMVLAKLVTTGKTKLKSVYDPTCGSGSLLLRVAKEVEEVSNFYGQELNRTTYNLARMNMILHDVHYRKFDIKQEDTLEHPQHIEHQFEAIVANPPFSAKWSANPLFTSDDRFSQYGKLAPASKADYAFVQHMIHHLAENGTMAVVLPHGVLYRGNSELSIRKYIIDDKNYLDAIIGLPTNIFYGAKLETCIMVFKKCRENPDNVLFIDGSKGFEKGDKQNIIRRSDIDKIIDTYRKRKVIDRYSYCAPISEIKENNYYLNIFRYVKQIETEKGIDLGGISADIIKLQHIEKKIDEKIKKYCDELGISSPFSEKVINNLQNGKIRFKNSNNTNYLPWQNQHLKEVLFEHKTKNKDLKFSEVFSVAKEKGVINQIEHLGRSYASDDLSTYKVIYPGDIVYTKSPTADFPYGIIKQNKTNRTGVVSTLYAVFKPKHKSIGLLLDYYFSSWVNTLNYLKPIINKGAKNTINLNNDAFLTGVKIFLPVEEEEIIKLTDFFSVIDEKIYILEKQNKSFLLYKKGLFQQSFK